MSLNISTIKNKIEPKLRGTTINKLAGSFNDKCAEAASNVLLRTNPPETIRKTRIENAIYSHIYDYAISQDIKGDNSVIDIRPIEQRSPSDDIHGRTEQEFDLRRDRDTFAIEMVNSTKVLRLSKRVGSHRVLHTMDALTGIGTVTGSGDVENLTTNTLELIAGAASVQFGLSGATGQGIITVTLPSAVDLSDIEDVGALFHWINFPTASRLSSIQFRWGSDSSNYWYSNITAPHDRTSFEDAVFTLQRADWVSASEQGTPDSSSVTHIAIVFNYTAGDALTNVRVDNITAGGGKAYEALYYTDRFFKSTAGSYLGTPTADTDVILIGQDGHNIFLYELMLVIAAEIGEKFMTHSKRWLQDQLNGYGDVPGLYHEYNSKYPTKVLPKSTTYHDFGFFNNSDVY